MRKIDPLVRAVKKAYKASAVGQLDNLLKERARWSRKRTIAETKLAVVQAEIQAFASALASEADKAERKGPVLQ